MFSGAVNSTHTATHITVRRRITTATRHRAGRQGTIVLAWGKRRPGASTRGHTHGFMGILVRNLHRRVGAALPAARNHKPDARNANPDTGIAKSDTRNANPRAGIAESDIRNANPRAGIAASDSRNANPRAGIAISDSRNANRHAGIAISDTQNAIPDAGNAIMAIRDHGPAVQMRKFSHKTHTS